MDTKWKALYPSREAEAADIKIFYRIDWEKKIVEIRNTDGQVFQLTKQRLQEIIEHLLKPCPACKDGEIDCFVFEIQPVIRLACTKCKEQFAVIEGKLCFLSDH